MEIPDSFLRMRYQEVTEMQMNSYYLTHVYPTCAQAHMHFHMRAVTKEEVFEPL